jgi:hypothetical protein
MKKVIFGFVVLTLMFSTSCKNNNSTSSNSWSFAGNSYTSTTCVGVSNTLTASNASSSNLSNISQLTVNFPGSSLPTTGGTYTVVNNYGNDIF